MAVNLQAPAFMGEKADISISPSSLLVRRGAQEIGFPTAKIIAIHIKDSKALTGSHKRVRATVLALEESRKGSDGKSDDSQGGSPIFKSFEIEFTQQDDQLSHPLLLHHLPAHLLLQPTNGQPNIHIIISTLSGTHKAADFFSGALKPLLDQLQIPPYSVYKTENADSITQFTQNVILPRANAGMSQLVILLSGDGGVVDIVNTLLRETEDGKPIMVAKAAIPTIALIPMGTGNALFNSSCRPPTLPQPSPTFTTPVLEDQTLGLRPLLFGTTKPLPTFPVTFSPGSTIVSYPAPSSFSASPNPKPVHTPFPSTRTMHSTILLSWCLHASLISLSDSPLHRSRGSARFTSAAKELLYPPDGSSTHVYKGVVSALRRKRGDPKAEGDEAKKQEWLPLQDSSGDVRRQHIYILATTVRELEAGFTISPASEPVDGKLRLLNIGGEVGADEVVRLLGLAWRGGGHVRQGEGVVGYEEVEGVRVDFQEGEVEVGARERKEEGGEDDAGFWRRVCVDGTIVQCPRDGWVEVRKNGDEDGKKGEVVRLVVP